VEKELEEITTVWELYLGGRSPSRQCVRLHFYKLLKCGWQIVNTTIASDKFICYWVFIEFKTNFSYFGLTVKLRPVLLIK
jgi:hypothetical protein